MLNLIDEHTRESLLVRPWDASLEQRQGDRVLRPGPGWVMVMKGRAGAHPF